MLAGCGADERPAAPGQPYEERQATSKPNLVVVMTDDQTVSQYREAMPFTRRFFAERGTNFTDAIATPPLCCPARAGFLTGQYPHNHGVFRNTPGYPDLRDPQNTLPVWLDRAGYRTAMVGKYLNGYDAIGGAEPAPGWDRWVAMLGYGPYFGFRLSVDGREEQTRGEYSTDVLTEHATEFVSESARRNRSFFLWLAYNAPHVASQDSGPCSPQAAQPPSDAELRRFDESELPQPSAFAEPDRSDKPRWLRTKAPLDAAAERRLREHWRCALAATAAVDEGFERLVGELERSGALEDTLVVFVSDNGLAFGENRILEEKRLPYEPIARVPLAIAPPGPAEPPEVSGDLVGTIDLAPTLLGYAGAEPCAAPGECREPDGRSLRPLLEGRASWPQDRGLLLELTDTFGYHAIRTPRYLYSELTKAEARPLDEAEIELYDLERDPGELENLWAIDRRRGEVLRAKLEPRLEQLRECAGSSTARDGTGTPGCE